MECSTPGFPVLHYLSEFAQTHPLSQLVQSLSDWKEKELKRKEHLTMGKKERQWCSCGPKSSALSSSVISSVAQSCLILCDSMNCSTPGIPVHYQLPELAQTHVHQVSDTIQPSHPLSSPSSTFSLSQQQGLFQWVSSSHQVARVLEFQLQHQSFQWIFRIDFL